MESAHVPGHEITSTQLSLNNYNLMSRSFDSTLKHWDLRFFSKPIGVASDLPCFHEEQNCIYSPNEKYCLTGYAERKTGASFVHVYDKQSFELVQKLAVPAPAVKLLWPTQINQLFAGLSNGDIAGYYGEQSRNGVLKAIAKEKVLAVDDYDRVMGGLEMLGEIHDPEPVASSDEEEWETGWTDNRNATKPALPYAITGPGKDGQIGTNLTKLLMRDKIKNTIRNEDPREALLKYAEVAESKVC
jgi:peptidoglycan hydrolase-like protein with peptidoglycan-binding domain